MAKKRKKTPRLPSPETLSTRDLGVARLTEILSSADSNDHQAIRAIKHLIDIGELDGTPGDLRAKAETKLNGIIESKFAIDYQKRRARKTLDELERLTDN